ncbi:MAG: hypothetical protein KA138_02595, partial [Saprospiraceae bacterium]|nr:hypothetical protein [Saprospiraceae bacterium]
MKKLSILFLSAKVLTTAGRIVLATMTLFLPCLVFAQSTEGVVTYTETIKMKIEVPEGMNEE